MAGRGGGVAPRLDFFAAWVLGFLTGFFTGIFALGAFPAFMVLFAVRVRLPALFFVIPAFMPGLMAAFFMATFLLALCFALPGFLASLFA